VRAANLIGRMSLDELAGLMVHGNLPTLGRMSSIGWGTAGRTAQGMRCLPQTAQRRRHRFCSLLALRGTPGTKETECLRFLG
jgi:hypothetical protein